MSESLLSYNQVQDELGDGRSHLLLGNGFSISCDKIFLYQNLYKFAKDNGLNSRVQEVFGYLGTNNFEAVLRLLQDVNHLADCYAPLKSIASLKDSLEEDTKEVKDALVAAVAKIHPAKTLDIAENRKDICADFLSGYHNIFTTNYDLLLYWVEMHAHDRLQGRDGFASDIDDPEAPYVVFSEHTKNQKGIFFIHGALHLFVVDGEIRKHTWKRTGKLLTENILTALERQQYPLFVAEGAPERKLDQIHRNGYLSYCLGKLQRIENNLVTVGLAFGTTDQHIADVLAENRELKTIFVGIHGDPNNELNRMTIERTNGIKLRRERFNRVRKVRKPVDLTVKFFNVSSAKIWD